MIETRFGILIRHPDGTKRKFGQVSRSDKGDVYANWTVPEPPFKPGVPEWNPHGSYHASGQVHSKSHNRIGVKKNRQVPGPAFVGAEPLEAINADRALLMSLPVVAETFDDTFEIDVSLITGSPKQSITVDLVEPNADPVRLTGNDIVIAEKTFSDKVPWIVVSLIDRP